MPREYQNHEQFQDDISSKVYIHVIKNTFIPQTGYIDFQLRAPGCDNIVFMSREQIDTSH
jgi:hypothetical protein